MIKRGSIHASEESNKERNCRASVWSREKNQKRSRNRLQGNRAGIRRVCETRCLNSLKGGGSCLSSGSCAQTIAYRSCTSTLEHRSTIFRTEYFSISFRLGTGNFWNTIDWKHKSLKILEIHVFTVNLKTDDNVLRCSRRTTQRRLSRLKRWKLYRAVSWLRNEAWKRSCCWLRGRVSNISLMAIQTGRRRIDNAA